MDKILYLIELSESDRTLFGREVFATQPEEQKVFSAIWALESQVNNGGFAQYLTSHDGDTATFVPQALREIGAMRCADIVDRTIQLVSSGRLPEDKGERERLIDALDDEDRGLLDELDSEFFDYPDDLTELLYEYVRSRPRAFGPTDES